MSRSGGETTGTRGRRAIVAALVIGALLAPAVSLGQGVGQGGDLALDVSVRQALVRLQEDWLQWTGAFYGSEQERASEVVDRLLGTAQQLGMERLPDLAAGAAVLAVQAAEEGDFERARLGLDAAERLDPRRPEAAFARARVARLAGDWPGVVVAQANASWRLLHTGLELRLAGHELVRLAALALLLSGALFVALLAAAHGSRLTADLARLLGVARLSPVVATLAAATALLWPLALPSGVLWLILWWSALLWAYGSASVRGVLVGLWLVAGLAPALFLTSAAWVDLDLSPPARAMDALEDGALYGGLFSDLGVLPTMVGDEPAVDQLLGDLHLRLGQGERARGFYLEVVQEEPDNVAALINLGVFHHRKGDFGNAVGYYQSAASADATSAAAYFNLGRAHMDSYRYDEGQAALDRARSLDPRAMERWTGAAEPVALPGGLERRGEILAAFEGSWSRDDAAESQPLELVRRFLPLAAVAAVVALAVVFWWLRRRRTGGDGEEDAGPEAAAEAVEAPAPTPGPRARRLVPGLAAAADGRGLVAWLACLAPALALTLLFGRAAGLAIPWGHDPGLGWLAPLVAIGLLVAWLLPGIVTAGRGR